MIIGENMDVSLIYLQLKALLSGGVLLTTDACDIYIHNVDHKLYNKYRHLFHITK